MMLLLHTALATSTRRALVQESHTTTASNPLVPVEDPCHCQAPKTCAALKTLETLLTSPCP